MSVSINEQGSVAQCLVCWEKLGYWEDHAELLEWQIEHAHGEDTTDLENALEDWLCTPKCDICGTLSEDDPDWCGVCGQCGEHCVGTEECEWYAHEQQSRGGFQP